MPTVATIPVTIQPDAAALLSKLGQERELALMLEHAKATIPHLRALDVVLHDFPETGPPGLTIDAHRDPYPGPSDRAGRAFGDWMVETFPPEVLQNFSLLSIHHTDEG
jgi:hypothetical protein